MSNTTRRHTRQRFKEVFSEKCDSPCNKVMSKEDKIIGVCTLLLVAGGLLTLGGMFLGSQIVSITGFAVFALAAISGFVCIRK